MNAESEIRRLSREVKALSDKVQVLIDERQKSNDLMTVTEFANLKGCSRGTVINRIKAGIYGAVRYKNKWYLPSPK